MDQVDSKNSPPPQLITCLRPEHTFPGDVTYRFIPDGPFLSDETGPYQIGSSEVLDRIAAIWGVQPGDIQKRNDLEGLMFPLGEGGIKSIDFLFWSPQHWPDGVSLNDLLRSFTPADIYPNMFLIVSRQTGGLLEKKDNTLQVMLKQYPAFYDKPAGSWLAYEGITGTGAKRVHDPDIKGTEYGKETDWLMQSRWGSVSNDLLRSGIVLDHNTPIKQWILVHKYKRDLKEAVIDKPD